MTTSYYRIQAASLNPADMLDPANQTSLSYSTDTERAGISVCDSIEALAEYLAQSGVPFTADSVVVTLHGTPSIDTPEDAHLGEHLIHPTKIVSIEPMTDRLADAIDTAYDRIYA